MSDEVKIVPALCTQCGGKVEVDPSREKAECPFCHTEFIIEKAVNNYNIEHATIEHADNVNIDMTGSVKSVLDFVGEQMNESRKVKAERRKEEDAHFRNMQMQFLKIFGVLFAVMIVFGIIYMIVMNVIDDGADETDSMSSVSNFEANDQQSQLTYNIDDGALYVNVTYQNDVWWEYLEDDSVGTVLDSEINTIMDGYQSCVRADIEEGTGYVVTAMYYEGGGALTSDPYYYSIVRVEIENGEIVDVTDSVIVDSPSEYDFE